MSQILSMHGNIAGKRRGGFDWSWNTVQAQFVAGLSSVEITGSNQIIKATLPNLPDNGWMTYGWEGGTLMADGQHVLLINAEDQSANNLTKYDMASLDIVKTWPTTKGSMRTHLLSTGQILIWPKNAKGKTIRIMDPDTEVWTDVNNIVDEISIGRGDLSYSAGASAVLLSDGVTLLHKVNYPVGHTWAGQSGAWSLLNTQDMTIEFRDPTRNYTWNHGAISAFGEMPDGRIFACVRDADDDAQMWEGRRYCIYDFATDCWTTWFNAWGNSYGYGGAGRPRPNWFNPNEIIYPEYNDDGFCVCNTDTLSYTVGQGMGGSFPCVQSISPLPNGEMYAGYGQAPYGVFNFSNLAKTRWGDENSSYCRPGKLVQTITGNAVQINTASGYRQICYSDTFNDHTIPLNALTSPWMNSL